MEIGPLAVSDGAVAHEVVRLQRRAYAVEAALIESDAIPALTETLEELQRSGEHFLGAYVDTELAGFVSWKCDGATLDVHRLVVDPRHSRKGIGTALVEAVLAAVPHERAVVQTGAANEPAKSLYAKLGFRAVGSREAVPGLMVTLFERDPDF